MDKIHIRDLEVFARHGVLEEEARLGQKFILNATLLLDTRPAGQNDALHLTLHYGEVARQMTQLVQDNRYLLIERVAEVVAETLLLTRPLLQGVILEVKKPWAPIGLPLKEVSVEIVRQWHRAYLSIGSNMGDKEAYLENGIAFLKKNPRIQVDKISSFYETEPYGGVEQDIFLNGAVSLRTLLTPEELLEQLQQAEQEAHRERVIHWGPRTLDMDLLLYDQQLIEETNLVVPHPEMAKREFVLQPLAEIAPYVHHPVSGLTVQEMLEQLRQKE